jgi:sugar lactone lactonase YvrE
MSATKPRPVFHAETTLGEGPVWHAGALWFVDIKRYHIHRFDPATGHAQRWDAPGQVGWVLPHADGGMIAGLQSGVHRFEPVSGSFTLLHDPEPALPGNRLNDSTTDAYGRIWFGSMDDAEEGATGRLYRLSADGCVDSGLDPVVITNGPAIAPDGKTLYHTDTLGKRIWRVPLGDDGSLGKPSLFVDIDGEGYPDGSVVDSEGCVWVGLFAGWGVRRYDTDGKLVQSVRFPVANITKIAFGGPDLKTAYATTARKGLSAAQLAAQPEAGSLFAFDAGVVGMPVTPARI